MSQLAKRSSHDKRHVVHLNNCLLLSHKYLEQLMINVIISPIDHPVELN